ncbi:hypothetical protein ACWER6_13315 [Streptomyces sp. NPDC004009]
MIYRHCIAPPRAYTQFSHDIIRHPRLSSDAVRLLTWQLSLPQGTRESLSRTAERANIGACAFTRAKRQLKDEGFVHERRVQGPGGHWVTQQLVSNVPLQPAEATKLLARMPVAPPQVAPSPRNPTAGERTGRLTDGLPYGDTYVDTHNQPPEDAPDAPAPAEAPEAAHASPAPETPQAQVAGENHGEGRVEPSTPHLKEARALVASYRDLDPALRTIPRAMDAELTDLTARWLAAGHPPSAIRAHILRNLPDGDTRVHRPGGLLRYLLAEVPRLPPASTSPPPRHAPPRIPQAHSGLSTRLATLRECEGDHVQATLFRPTGEEPRCPACTAHTTTVHR